VTRGAATLVGLPNLEVYSRSGNSTPSLPTICRGVLQIVKHSTQSRSGMACTEFHHGPRESGFPQPFPLTKDDLAEAHGLPASWSRTSMANRPVARGSLTFWTLVACVSLTSDTDIESCKCDSRQTPPSHRRLPSRIPAMWREHLNPSCVVLHREED
jgi:hypothetical protein